MHPFRLAFVELLGELPDPALEVLLPQAAASSATTLNAAAALIVPLTVTLLFAGQPTAVLAHHALALPARA
jgi:hypothetical protein